MICPRCKTNLEMSVIHDIEIDHCPACKGVWLDRGELDKIIERTNSFDSYAWRRNEYHGHHNDDHETHYDKHDHDHKERSDDNHFGLGNDYYANQTQHRRKGFLSELFDF